MARPMLATSFFLFCRAFTPGDEALALQSPVVQPGSGPRVPRDRGGNHRHLSRATRLSEQDIFHVTAGGELYANGTNMFRATVSTRDQRAKDSPNSYVRDAKALGRNDPEAACTDCANCTEEMIPAMETRMQCSTPPSESNRGFNPDIQIVSGGTGVEFSVKIYAGVNPKEANDTTRRTLVDVERTTCYVSNHTGEILEGTQNMMTCAEIQCVSEAHIPCLLKYEVIWKEINAVAVQEVKDVKQAAKTGCRWLIVTVVVVIILGLAGVGAREVFFKKKAKGQGKGKQQPETGYMFGVQ